jgi:serine/threonine-protein kinase
VSRESLEVALTLQRRTGRKLGQVLAEEGLADPDHVVRALSEQSGLPCITDEKLQSIPIPEAQVRVIPEELCEKLCAVPVGLRGRELYFAVREPRDLEVLDALKFAAGVFSVRGVFASETAIRRAIRRFYRGYDLRVPGAGADAASRSAQARVLQFAEQFTGRPVLDAAALSSVAEPQRPAPALPASREVEESAPLQGVLLPDEGVLTKIQFLHKRLLDGAMAMLGGCAVMEPYLVRLARCTAARMGATSTEENLAGVAASVITLAARLQEPRRFILPEPLCVQALVGSEFPEIAAILSSVLPTGGDTRPPTGRVESATLCAVTFAQEIQCVHPGPAEAARALQVLRQNPRLPRAALEALATELGAYVHGRVT